MTSRTCQKCNCIQASNLRTTKDDERELEEIAQDVQVSSSEDEEDACSKCDGCSTRILPLVEYQQGLLEWYWL